MASALHVSKQEGRGWAVTRSDRRRATSVHQTQAEAIAAGRRLALKSGGAELVVHGSDGRIRQRDTIGAAALDERKRADASAPRPEPRAPRSEGPRTTVRLPDSLAIVAEHLADELGISRNDALLRLATRGAQIYEQEQSIAARRDARWAAVVPGVVDIDRTEFPSPQEAEDAIMASRGDAVEPTAGTAPS